MANSRVVIFAKMKARTKSSQEQQVNLAIAQMAHPEAQWGGRMGCQNSVNREQIKPKRPAGRAARLWLASLLLSLVVALEPSSSDNQPQGGHLLLVQASAQAPILSSIYLQAPASSDRTSSSASFASNSRRDSPLAAAIDHLGHSKRDLSSADQSTPANGAHSQSALGESG